MDKLTKEDALTLEKFSLRGQVFDLRCDAINRELAQFRAEREAHFADMKKKYDLADGDSVDIESCEIKRAPRAVVEETKAEAPIEEQPKAEEVKA